MTRATISSRHRIGESVPLTEFEVRSETEVQTKKILPFNEIKMICKLHNRPKNTKKVWSQLRNSDEVESDHCTITAEIFARSLANF